MSQVITCRNQATIDADYFLDALIALEFDLFTRRVSFTSRYNRAEAVRLYERGLAAMEAGQSPKGLAVLMHLIMFK